LKVWLNGKLLEEADACIAPSDRGLLLGHGIFETLRSYDGRLPTLAQHLQRLAAGASAVGIEPPAPAELERGVLELLAASGVADARIRITVTAGPGPPPLVPDPGARTPTVLITAIPLRSWPPAASAVLAPWPHDERSPLAGVKTTSRAETVMALELARSRGAEEALFLNGAGNLCEASTANVFVVRDGCVETPPLSAGCLAGITREQVLALCGQLAIEAAERDIPRDALASADELFLTSSTRGVQSLARLDGEPVGDGAPGPVALRLAGALKSQLESL